MQVGLETFDKLTSADLAGWNEMRAVRVEYSHPFFQPEFAQLVSTLRSDVRILTVHEGDALQLIWAVQIGVDRVAWPIASPFSDVNGPILSEEFAGDLTQILSEVDLRGARFSGTGLSTRTQMHDYVVETDGVYIAEIADGVEAYKAWHKQAHSKYAKKMRWRRRKAEAQLGELTFTFDDRDPAAFDQVIAWKRAQYQQSGLHDVLAPDWVQMMMHQLYSSETPECRGVLSTLRAGDELLAGEFNLHGAGWVHGWITSYNVDYANLAPGLLILEDVIWGAAERGYRFVDLGAQNGHYKKYYAQYQTPAASGIVWGASPEAKLRAAVYRIWRDAEQADIPQISRLMGRLRRRSGVIWQVEETLVGRLQGMLQAARSAPKRSLNESTAETEEAA